MVYKKLLLLLLLLVLFQAKEAKALSLLEIPFGGPILAVYECTCSGGLLVLVLDYKTLIPIPLMYMVGVSRLNESFNIFTPSVQTVGSFVLGGVCSIGTASCTTIPVAGTISPYPLSGVGTGGI